MRLKVLGCSGGIGGDLKTTSLLIDDDILIDCGTGVGDLSLEDMAKLRHIFITHTHLDHIACLPLLVDTLFSHLQTHPLIVHAQAESMAVIKQHIFNWQIWPDFFELPEKNRPVVQFSQMKPEQIVSVEGREFEMIPVNHTVPTVGYRVSAGGASMAFSGDTTTNDGFWSTLNQHKGLDLLIVECGFGEHERELAGLAKHYCPSTLAADIVKLKHKPRLCITHLKPGDEEQIFSQLDDVLPQLDLHRLTGGEVFEL